MKLFIGGLIGLVLSVHIGAEPLLEGRVRLSSGQPAAGVQVRLFDLTDLRRFVGTTTDETGHFALPLRPFSTDRGTALPTSFSLGQNYPNPFNPSTVIPYQIPASTHVRLEVFNMLGQRLATLVDGVQSAGMHTAQWDGTDAVGRAVGAGMYIYRLSGVGVTVSRRMVLVDGQAEIPAVGTAVQGLVRSAVEESEEADGSVYGLVVSGQGLVPYVDSAFRVGADEAAIVVASYDGIPRMKIATSGILGDVDGNGRVDIIDALLVAMYSVDPSIPVDHIPNIALGDVDTDGDIDFTDAYLIGTYSVNPSDPVLPPEIGQVAPDLVPSVSGTSVDLDPALSQMYWIEGTGTIYRANLNGSNIEVLVTGLGNLSGLALDGVGGQMYWTEWDWDPGTGTIYRASLNGSNIEVLVTGLGNLSGLALDGVGGQMYWTEWDWDPGTGTIYRANLDGSNIEVLVTGLGNLSGLALDGAGGQMYWTEWDAGTIHRANLNGSNPETLVTDSDRSYGVALVSRPVAPGPPDLIVEFPAFSDTILLAEQSFTLQATVRNRGNGQADATTLCYYRSTNETISARDTQVGTYAVGSLSFLETSTRLIDLTAPTSSGTYYYGACVESVSSESNTDNNCSGAVRVTVEPGPAAITPVTPEIVGLYGTLVSSFTSVFFAVLVGQTSVEGEGGGSVEIAGPEWTLQDFSPDGALIINGTLTVGLDQTPIPLTGTVTLSGAQEAELVLDMALAIEGTDLSATGTITIDGAEFDVAEVSAAAAAAAEAAEAAG